MPSKHCQCVTELFLERVRIERPCLPWPVAHRVIDVGQHRERSRTPDQTGYLGQVLSDHLGRWPLPIQARRLEELLANRQGVQGREHPVELSGIQQLCGDIAMPMGFAQLHPADDPKVRELVAAALHTLQVSV
jgi:hypothetical protein